jgi:hypothetical protein
MSESSGSSSSESSEYLKVCYYFYGFGK